MFVSEFVRGCYPVLDRPDAARASALVSGGARVLQVRVKGAGAGPRDVLEVAQLARRVTREHGAALVIDDLLDVALAVDADGVHLGQTDLPLAAARAALRGAGRAMWIGVSTHDLGQVEAAVAGGADYLGFGPVFPTTTKTHPDPVVGLEGLRAAVVAARGVPVVAIGGISRARAGEIAATGAAAACVIADLEGVSDLAGAVREIATHWNR